jgi:hypothetical protein
MPDNDTLDLSGDWELRYGYTQNIAWGTDESGHMVPNGDYPWIPVHFTPAGSNAHGGPHYNGTSPVWPATIEADTYYNGQGVQLFSMFAALGGTLELHCGVHYPFYQNDRRGVHIIGSWCNVGGGLEFAKMGKGGNPYFHCQFVMRKKIRK